MKRDIYIVETAPTAKEYKSFPVLLSDEELNQLKQERPDLIVKPAEPVIEEDTNEERIIGAETVQGMSIPVLKTK